MAVETGMIALERFTGVQKVLVHIYPWKLPQNLHWDAYLGVVHILCVVKQQQP
jgi:hypothetical protein